jgi:hypothetical protein
MAVTQQTTVAAALTAGPFGQLLAITQQPGDPAAAAYVAAGTSAVLAAGNATGAGFTAGLNFAGIAAVAGAADTYYSGLSAAKKAQVGLAAVSISQGGISIPCHSADVASLASTLAAVLDTSGNYGPVGT